MLLYEGLESGSLVDQFEVFGVPKAFKMHKKASLTNQLTPLCSGSTARSQTRT